MALVPSPLDHVTLVASDLPASLAFYDAVLGELGLERAVDLLDEEDDEPVEAAGWGRPGAPASLWVVTGARPSAGVHLAFAAADAATVERFHAAALAHGGTSHDAPRRWPLYRRGTFNAIVADPDGNLVEAIAPE